jgi:hypothetical protein
VAIMTDADSRAAMAEQRRDPDESKDAEPDSNAPVDPKAFMRSVLQQGLFPAMRRDIVVLRAVVRSINLLDPPQALMTNPDVMGRVMAVWQDRDKREESQLDLGPPRAEMLKVLADAA